MNNAVRLAGAMLCGALGLPTLKYLVCGDGTPEPFIRISLAIFGAACGLALELARRALQR